MRHVEIVPTFVAQLDGKVLPNAHAVVDVDGDGLDDVVLGSVNGAVAVYKISPTRFIKKQECRVNGCVSAICADGNVPNDERGMRIFVATTDGSCFVIQATESGDDFFPLAEFRVALNVSDVAHHRGFVVFGTREGSVLVYSHDENAFGGFGHAHSFSLGVEIEAFTNLVADQSTPQLLARCTTGEIFELQINSEGQVSSSKWRAPSMVDMGAASFLVDTVHVPTRGDDCLACGSLAGRVELLTQNGEVVWDFELPEAIVGMDRLKVAEHSDAIVACTWSGIFYVVADQRRVAHFRMVLPASSMFCADVLMSKPSSPRRVLFAISTSGVIAIYLGLSEALNRVLDDRTHANLIEERAIVKHLRSEEMRRAVLKKLLEKTHQSDASELCSALAQPDVSIQDLVRLATTQRW